MLPNCPTRARLPVTSRTPLRVFSTPNTPVPEVQLLSNGRYHVMVTNAGGGYSRWKDIAVTRWREDSTCDNWGTFCYIRDVDSGEFWSTAHQPTLQTDRKLRGDFLGGARGVSPPRQRYRHAHRDRGLAGRRHRTAPDHASPTASGRSARIEVTSYAEVVLAPPAADAAASGFQQSVRADGNRPRAPGDSLHPPAALARRTRRLDVSSDGGARGRQSERFPTRRTACDSSAAANTVADPQAMRRYRARSRAARARCSIRSSRSGTASRSTRTRRRPSISSPAWRETRERLPATWSKNTRIAHLADRVFELAWTHSQVVLRQINATEADAQLYGRLAGSVIYANASLRAEPAILLQESPRAIRLLGLRHLRRSADRAAAIGDPANIDLVRQLVQAHAYWRLKGLPWTGDLERRSRRLPAAAAGPDHGTDLPPASKPMCSIRPGGIFVRRADQISDEDRILLQTVARVIITDSGARWRTRSNRREPLAGIGCPALQADPSAPSGAAGAQPSCRAAI